MCGSSNINSQSRRSFIRQRKQEKLYGRLRLTSAMKPGAAWKEKLRLVQSVAEQISPYPPRIYISIDTAAQQIAVWIESQKDVRHRRDAASMHKKRGMVTAMYVAGSLLLRAWRVADARAPPLL